MFTGRLSRIGLSEIRKAASSCASPVCRAFSTSTCAAQVHPRGSYYEAVMKAPSLSSYPLHPPTGYSTAKAGEVQLQTTSEPLHMELLSTPSSKPSSTSTESKTFAPAPSIKELPATDRELGPEERAKLVFGSPLTGPERLANLQTQGTVINSVKIPKKPEEPDNCCMSGCVHCVWDIYQDEMLQWQAAMKQAEEAALEEPSSKASSPINPTKGPTGALQTSTKEAGTKDTKKSKATLEAERKKEEDKLFENVPVGIRQFMMMEKKMKNQKSNSAPHES
ncbi:hypothetical protein BROUX41_002909 [Berkeleyomyces rouxiae]|uniref:uncharacterized protein n=1 Tax=Berkeleyomyces rouxiae TaxID=2035830 RepID=UPI003B78049F